MSNNRLSHIKQLLKENELDAALISNLSNIIHLTNFSYFTDIEREAFLFITKNNQYILTDSRYSHAVKTLVKKFTLLELSVQTSLTSHLQNIIRKEKIITVGLEENDLRVHEYKKITTIMKKNKHIDISAFRSIKQLTEIQKIKKACAIGDKAFVYILKHLKPSLTEKNVAALLEIFIKQQAAELSFSAIVAYGANAAVPHHKTGNTKLKTNDLVLLDFGVKYENYCSDMTRTVFIGKPTPEQKKVYQTVLIAQQKAIEQFNNVTMKPSKSLKATDIDKVAREYIISKGYPSIPHSLGHGIGLQVHEAPSLSPKSKNILTDGMVFSIEPGIYLNDKFGVRIEDLFTIQKGKLVQLTKSTKNLIEIPTR